MKPIRAWIRAWAVGFLAVALIFVAGAIAARRWPKHENTVSFQVGFWTAIVYREIRERKKGGQQ